MTTRLTESAAPVGWIRALLASESRLWAVGEAVRSFTSSERVLLVLLVLLGALVRFWGVGSFGLHAPDEGTTALPALHILQDGVPRFPSGMLYTRALAHLYLLAGSVAVFGNNEWALRLPSVLCGTGLVALSVLMGRRFLQPAWNLGFAAVVAFLPGLITDSQVVRMYIFLIATLALYTHWVFRWESMQQRRFLVAAVLTMVVGIHFQQLAIFGSLVLFMPGLLHGDWRRFRAACVAFVPIALYFVYIRWTPSFYPLPITDFAVPDAGAALPPVAKLRLAWPSLIAALAMALLLLGLFARGARSDAGARFVAVCGLGAAACAAVMYYHLALVLLLVMLVITARQGRLRLPAALVVATAFGALATWQLHTVLNTGGLPLRKALGVMVGQPSVWQYSALASFSLPAALLVVVGVLQALVALGNKRKLPDLWLFFVLTVAVPMFLMGLTDWYFPPRYVEFALLPTLLTAVAVGQQLLQRFRPLTGTWLHAAAVLLLAVLVVNPVAAARTINAGNRFADHRGEARYVQAQHPGPRDIVVAEDVLYPWYYLGHVDYWLMGRAVARNFAERVNGTVVYQYTHTPLLGTAEELQALIDRPDRGVIYIIGSGEDMGDGRRYLRGAGIAELLESGRLETVFIGRDGLSRVWRVPPASQSSPSGAH